MEIIYQPTDISRKHPNSQEKVHLCYCNGRYTSGHWKQHRNTKKHKKFIDSLTPQQFYQIFRWSNLI